GAQRRQLAPDRARRELAVQLGEVRSNFADVEVRDPGRTRAASLDRVDERLDVPRVGGPRVRGQPPLGLELHEERGQRVTHCRELRAVARATQEKVTARRSST